MKSIHVWIAIFFVTFCGFALAYTEFKDYGISTQDAKEKIFQYVSYQTEPTSGFFVEQSIRETCKRIPPEMRAAAVNTLGSLIREYLETNDFKERYEAWLKQNYSMANTDIDDNEKEQIKLGCEQEVSNYTPEILTTMVDMAKNMESSLQSMEEGMAKSGDLQPEVQMQLATMRKRVALAKEIDPLIGKDFDKAMKAYVDGESKIRIEEAEESKKKMALDMAKMYEERKDPNKVIAKQLYTFIKSTDDIDYKAATEEKNGTVYFKNKEYESKPGAWKMGYRMGKEATDAARDFANKWLKDLEN